MKWIKSDKRSGRIIYVNRALLSYCLFAAGVWLIGFPILMAVQTEFSAWLNYAVLGALLLPVFALLLVFGRVLAWLILYAYWPIQALMATLMMLMLSAVVVVYHSQPPLILNGFDRPILMGSINVPQLMRVEPQRVATSVFSVAVGLLVVTLILFASWGVFRRGRGQLDHSETLPLIEQSEVQQPKPLTYLDQRQPKP